MITKDRTVPMRIPYNSDRPQFLFGKGTFKALFEVIEREQENGGTR